MANKFKSQTTGYETTWRKLPPEIQLAVWLKTDGRCWYCGEQTDMAIQTGITGQAIGKKFTIDHFTPRRFGGTDELDNLVPACWSCNSSKHRKSVDEYRDNVRWRGIGRFTAQQIAWLHSHGIELPEPPEVIFYFEKIGGTE